MGDRIDQTVLPDKLGNGDNPAEPGRCWWCLEMVFIIKLAEDAQHHRFVQAVAFTPGRNTVHPGKSGVVSGDLLAPSDRGTQLLVNRIQGLTLVIRRRMKCALQWHSDHSDHSFSPLLTVLFVLDNTQLSKSAQWFLCCPAAVLSSCAVSSILKAATPNSVREEMRQ